jgi:hypothetical protein
MSDLDVLAQALAQAEAERAADVEALGAMTDDELRYLAEAGDLPDPDTDGVEDERCI